MRRTHCLALLLLATLSVGAAGCARDTCSAAGQSARSAEDRIRAACAAASVDLQYTIDLLEPAPDTAVKLATKDLAWIPLCGGDAEHIQTILLMGDTIASRYALLQLREQWCPGCAAVAARERRD